jgi:hypothetical protein
MVTRVAVASVMARVGRVPQKDIGGIRYLSEKIGTFYGSFSDSSQHWHSAISISRG